MTVDIFTVERGIEKVRLREKEEERERSRGKE
jgi:hypothetical protein